MTPISWRSGALPELLDDLRRQGLTPQDCWRWRWDPKPTLKPLPQGTPFSGEHNPPPFLQQPYSLFEAHAQWPDGRRLLILGDGKPWRWAWFDDAETTP